MDITIPEAVSQLLRIVKQLQSAYPGKKFTLDGRLVGDLGEILVREAYDVQLNPNLQKHHDAIASDGRQVQIKATMKQSLSFPVDHIPDYYLGIKIHSDGSFEEVFNGPGSIAWEAVKNRKPTKTNLHSVSVNSLARWSAKVQARDRIPLRAKKSAARDR